MYNKAKNVKIKILVRQDMAQNVKKMNIFAKKSNKIMHIVFDFIYF
jgi:hypothetical protein